MASNLLAMAFNLIASLHLARSLCTPSSILDTNSIGDSISAVGPKTEKSGFAAQGLRRVGAPRRPSTIIQNMSNNSCKNTQAGDQVLYRSNFLCYFCCLGLEPATKVGGHCKSQCLFLQSVRGLLHLEQHAPIQARSY